MQENTLNAIERVKQPGKFKEKGFVPGVIYGDGIATANSVKFAAPVLNAILARHGANARVMVKYNDNIKLGFIKEVQKDAISRVVKHVDIQIVAKDQQISLQVPIIFKGQEELASRQLQLQVYKPEVSVLATMDLMPGAIHIDASDMTLGDAITLSNFNLDKQIKVNDKEDTVYGVITHQSEKETEVTEDVKDEGTADETAATETKTE